MMEAVLLVEPPHSWIRRIVSKYPVTIRLLDCKALLDREGVQELFEMTGQGEISDRLIEDLRKDDYVFDVDVLKGKAGRLIGSVKTHKCTACRSFATANCFLISATTRPDGRVEWVILGGQRAVPDLLKRLEKDNVKVEVSRISNVEDQAALTARQEQILQIALEKGYFDFPKKINIRDLAKTLDISTATLAEILRRGQKRVLAEHFRGRTSVLSRQVRLA
jgi:predicted DNA binding protein